MTPTGPVNPVHPSEVLPKGFIGRLLQEFGTEWTNLVLLTGVIISSFGLDRYLNAGVWTLGAICGFAFVYVFRRSIDSRFPRYVLACAGGTVAIVVGSALVASLTHYSPVELLEQHRETGTLILGVVITIPVAICIISYRKQDVEELLPLPEQIESLVAHSVLQSPVCHRGVVYVIEFGEPSHGFVDVNFEVTLLPYNRTKRVYRLKDVFDPGGADSVYLNVSIDNDVLDPNDPDYRSDRGLTLTRDIPPGQQQRWNVKVQSRYHDRDSDLFGSYYPSDSLSVLLKCPPPSLKVSFISYLDRKVDPKRLPNGDLVFEWTHGLLPFQGARLLWQPVVSP